MPTNWFDDPELVRQFPRLYRLYARYCRTMRNSKSGRIPGGTRLFRLIAKLHTSLGLDHRCGLRWGTGKLFLDLTDNRIFTVLEEVLGESPEHHILETLVGPGTTFVDIGANHGSYSLLASRLVGPTGMVLTFEPQARLAELVVSSLGSLGASPFKVLTEICTDHEGTMEFFVPSDASGSAGVFKSFSGTRRHKKTSVKATTLDACIAEVPDVKSLFLKIDVEGSEFSVLNGARRTIERFRPPILFEINPDSANASGHPIPDLLKLLTELGYDRFCEIEEFPKTRPVTEVDTVKQRNLLALFGHGTPN